MYKFNKFGKNYSELKPKVYKLFESGLNCTQIANTLGIFRKTVSKWLKEKGYNYSKVNKASINSFIFNKIDTEEKAYWLGFIFADGYVSSETKFELSLGLKDLEHLEKFKTFLNYKGKIYIDYKVGRCRLMFQDSQIVKDLKIIGCINNKSLVLEFPILDEILQNHFIRGYFDGDGYISKPEKSILISIVSTKQFLFKIHNIVQLPVDNIKHRNPKHSKEVFTNMISGKNARNLCLFMYNNSNIYLERKKIRAIKQLEKFKLVI
jgi:DNA-binding transcriptional regulator WhiA